MADKLMINQIIERVETLIMPIGVIGQVKDTVTAVATGIGVPLFTMLVSFLVSLIVVRIILKVI